jgi:hypothetical protein
MYLQFYFYTLFMAFDAHGNGVPVAWVITSPAMEIEVQKWLNALKEVMVQLKSSYEPSCFLVDDSRAEIAAKIAAIQ